MYLEYQSSDGGTRLCEPGRLDASCFEVCITTTEVELKPAFRHLDATEMGQLEHVGSSATPATARYG